MTKTLGTVCKWGQIQVVKKTENSTSQKKNQNIFPGNELKQNKT